MAERLCHAIELADMRAETTGHGVHAACVGVERHNRALHHRHLAFPRFEAEAPENWDAALEKYMGIAKGMYQEE